MNDPSSWDPSLVKKFSSSNHFKLLNQLRNEVKKYPLNNKKLNSSIQSNVNNLDNKSKSKDLHSQSALSSKNSDHLKVANSSKSTVSFNNAKNFSIYNNMSKSNINAQKESVSTEDNRSNDDDCSPTFKDRLNQIDMK